MSDEVTWGPRSRSRSRSRRFEMCENGRFQFASVHL